MLWLFLVISILAASSNSVLLHRLPGDTNLHKFNMIGFVVWIGVLLAANGFALSLTPMTVFWGILYGTVQVLFMFYKAQAMKNGPVSITTLIGNCSLILSTTVGVVVWKESVSIMQLLGILLLLAAFILCTYKKPDKTGQTSKKWLVYCLLFFSFAAGVGIIFKAFSKVSAGTGAGDMMIVAAATMLVFSGIKIWISRLTPKDQQKPPKETKSIWGLAVICGLLSCGYNRLNISLAGLFDSVIFYPCFNGGVILLSTVLSVIFLRERLTIRQVIGLALGIGAVVTVGIF